MGDNLELKKNNIMIVDDHPVVRAGISKLINAEKDLLVCCEANDRDEAIKCIDKESLDLIIMDLSLKDTSGLDLIEEFSEKFPDIPILTLSMHDESLYAERALRAGSKGYVMKHVGTDILIDAIRKVLSGKVYVSEDLASQMIGKITSRSHSSENSSPIESLSNRELEVFTLIGKGLGTGKIAEKLNLSVKTIETYRNNIKNKLNLDDASQLVQKATLFVHSIDSH
jgi:DNA-binding NarL/FixJ family response regulator